MGIYKKKMKKKKKKRKLRRGRIPDFAGEIVEEVVGCVEQATPTKRWQKRRAESQVYDRNRSSCVHGTSVRRGGLNRRCRIDDRGIGET
ncbi:unnamed protein product, partial [Cuscuta epithymum]